MYLGEVSKSRLFSFFIIAKPLVNVIARYWEGQRGLATEAICSSIRQIASFHFTPLAMTVILKVLVLQNLE